MPKQNRRVTRDQLSDEDAYNQGFAFLASAFRQMTEAGYDHIEANMIFADFILGTTMVLGGEPGAYALIERWKRRIEEVKDWEAEGKLDFALNLH